MDYNSLNDLERLEKQLFLYKPSIKSTEQKQNVSNRLRNQLLESKAVVKIQRMDAECESLMISLKQRLMLLQDILIPKDKEVNYLQTIKVAKDEDSSDDETLSTLRSKQFGVKQKLKMPQKGKVKKIEMKHADTSEPLDSYLPLTLRRNPRERKLSYKSQSSASTSNSKANRTKLHSKQDQVVTTSGVDFHGEEMLVEQEEVDTTPTLHIKIPSLHRGNVHYIILDSLNFARKVFDYRANEIKQQQQLKSISHNSTISKSHKKQIKGSSAPDLHQLTQQEQELELSQLIQDVMAEACNDETLQATSALENINNNLIDNYDPVANDTFITYSQSSQELSYSQNSNAIIETVCSNSEHNNVRKKTRKYTKRTNEQQLKEPPKKRGRKPKKKDLDGGEIQAQPPTKSNLAKYVEFFSNDCDLLPGSTTPAASSTRSQPLVSSTTHNFEVIDHLKQQREEQSQQPITYYIDGDWANGGPCQLVPTNGVSVDGRQLNQDDVSGPFHDFVNYIDNSGDSGNNALECNNSLPISLPIANLGLQNKNYNHHQASHQIHHQSTTIQSSLVPIINIQIPTLPNNIISSSEPQPAHTHKEVLDLSLRPSINVSSTEILNFHTQQTNNNLQNFCLRDDDDCLPLDLSAKSCNAKEKLSENSCVTIDRQDEDFIRHLIEQSDFSYSPEKIKRRDCSEGLTYEHDHTKSYEAALDMPLLDFDAANLEQLAVVDSAVTTNKSSQQKKLTDEIVYNDFTHNEDSNYVSMTTAVNSTIENNLNFSNQSTTEMFNKLLDICPDNQFLNGINDELNTNDDLNEIVFEECKVENSTMCEGPKSQKNQLEEIENEVFNTNATSEREFEEMELTSNTEPSSSSSLAVQLDSSNNTTNISIDMSFNSKFLYNNDSSDTLQKPKFQNATVCKINYDKSPHTEPSSLKNQEENYENVQDANEQITEVSDIDLSNKKVEENIIKMPNAKSINKTIVKDVNDEYLNNSPKISLITDTNFKPKEQTGSSMEYFKTNKNTNRTNDDKIDQVKEAEPLLKSSSNNSKPKDNVVFSVAKITLSEDDNLYTTDSDSSSGISELNRIGLDANIRRELFVSYSSTTQKSVDEGLAQYHNIERTNSSNSCKENPVRIVEQTNKDSTAVENINSENICKKQNSVNKEDLNIYNKEIEEIEIVENNVQEEPIEISKNSSDYTNTNVLGNERDEENMDILDIRNSNLTLLELESKLENSLDFDEDFDDALSLATSCFDSSPNDERFEDSVCDIETTTTTNTTQDLQQNYTNINPPHIKDYKHFKIPKLGESTKSPIKVDENNIDNPEPTNPVRKTLPSKSLKKITRTVKNDLVQLNVSGELMSAAKDLEDETTVLKEVIQKVFGITCLPYLVDKCHTITHCHQLNDNNKVYLNLNTLNNNQINLAYRVLYNHSKLFKIYFEVFCTYYSTKNERLKLLNMVNDCERYPEYAGFIVVIYEALVKCGLSRVNACRRLLKRIREKTIAASIIEALVAIIMKSDWTMFTDFIEKYTEDDYKFNFRIGILEQMAPAVLSSKGPHLKQVFGKCVQTLHCDETGLLLNSPTLIQCVSLLTTNTQ